MWEKLKKLLPSNHFLKGMGSVMNLSGGYFDAKVFDILNRTDKEALASDWEAIGQDLKGVLGEEYI